MPINVEAGQREGGGVGVLGRGRHTVCKAFDFLKIFLVLFVVTLVYHQVILIVARASDCKLHV